MPRVKGIIIIMVDFSYTIIVTKMAKLPLIIKFSQQKFFCRLTCVHIKSDLYNVIGGCFNNIILHTVTTTGIS